MIRRVVTYRSSPENSSSTSSGANISELEDLIKPDDNNMVCTTSLFSKDAEDEKKSLRSSFASFLSLLFSYRAMMQVPDIPRSCTLCLFLVIMILSTFWIIIEHGLPMIENHVAGDKIVLRWKITVTPPTGSYLGDDFREGKSCEYKRNRWHCRECIDGKCWKLKPKPSQCPAFRRGPLTTATTEYEPASTQAFKSLRTHRGMGVGERVEYRYHPDCTMETCFQMDRCAPTSDKIQVYTSRPNNDLLKLAADDTIELVDSVEDACIILVTNLDVDFPHGSAFDPTHNYLMWNMSRFSIPGTKRLSSDSALLLFHVGHAMIASDNFRTSTYRSGYDLSLPMERHWGRQGPFPDRTKPPLVQQRQKFLISYRGSVQDTVHRYYQHRWLAASYWDDEDDVVVDIRCQHSHWSGKKSLLQKYHHPATLYDELMYNSTFGFCPGGSGPTTYRFSEALSTNTIPVIVSPDVVLPFTPDLDWKKCVVEVPEARVVDIPNIVREIPHEEIVNRQNECRRLFLSTVGDRGQGRGKFFANPQVTFRTAMRIMRNRIAASHKQRSDENDLLQQNDS